MSVGTPSTQFKVLKEPAHPETALVCLVFVTVPWLLPARDWFLHPSSAQESFGGNVWIYAHEECQMDEGNFPLTAIPSHATKLADALCTLCTPSTARATPRRIILLAHSLAGVVTKQAIVLVNAQRSKYRELKEAIHGVVLLGTPHRSNDDGRQLLNETYGKILHLGGCRPRNRPQDDDDSLTSLSRKFDEVSGGLHIISIGESLPTKLGTRMRRTLQIIVNDRLVRIDSNIQETVAVVATDHRRIPSLRGENALSDMDNKALRLIRQLVDDAVSAIVLETRLAQLTLERDPALEPLIDSFATPRPYPKLPCLISEISRQHNKDFYGREREIYKLQDHLVPGPKIAILHGIGGVGKSEIALEFVHRYKNNFDAVFWIPSSDIAKMRDSFGRIAVHLGLQTEAEARSTDSHSSRNIAKAWLADPKKISDADGPTESKARWLVVFDGADVATTLHDFEPILNKGSVLITTQDPDLTSALPCCKDDVMSVKLEFFTQTEASSLLKKLAAKQDVPSDEDDAAAKEIVERYGYGGWPLAISQTAHTIRNKYDISLAEFRDLYTHEEDGNRIADSGQATITEVINLARLSAHATATLQICAMLDPDCIQERIFAAPPKSAKLLDGLPTTSLQFADARAELLRSSMVHRNPGKQELWLHREVQESVRRQCSPETFGAAFCSAAALIRNVWDVPRPQVQDHAKLWEPGAIFLPHALQLQEIYVQHSGSSNGQSLEPSLPFAWLLAKSASYHINLHNTVNLRNTLDLALFVCEQLPEKYTFELRTDIYHNLVAWANETNHAQECFDYNQRYLDMRLEAVSAGADPTERTAAAWNEYGTGLMMVGRNADAMDAFQKSIDMYGVVHNETQCPDSLPIVNLAVAKWLAKDYDGAAKMLETGRLAREDAYGYDDVQTFRYGRYLHAHGNVCWDQGQWSHSRIWHKRALQQYIRSLGNASHRTADVRHRMAMHCLRERDHENAGKLIDQALESWNLDPKSFRQEIARTTWLKAQQRAMSGNPVEAQELREEAAAMRAKILGSSDPTPPWSNLSYQDFDELVAFWSR